MASRIMDVANSVLLPAKLIVPQPVIARIPFLTTNEDIRFLHALRLMRGRALDIGCGNNRLIREYRRLGHSGIGVDVYDWGGQDLLVEDTSHLPYEERSFDTVTMIACINHIPNRLDVLKESHRLLRPGGHLILTNLTPKISWIWHKFAFWDSDQHERGMKEGEVFGLTDQELLRLTKQAGFSKEQVISFSLGLNAIYRFARDGG